MKEQSADEHKHRPESLMDSDSNDPNLKKKLMKNHGFLGIWMNMQKTFCGVDAPIISNKNTANSSEDVLLTNSSTKDTNDQFDSLNLSPNQLKSLSLLFQIMYSNPVILYSPNSTVVTDNLIRKSNATFELIDKMNLFFRQWLDNSEKLVDFLRHEQTNQSLSVLNSFKTIALSNNSYLSKASTTTKSTTTTTNASIRNKLNVSLFNEGDSNLLESLRGLSNRSVNDLIEKIQMIDSAACSWLSLMSGVNLNLFKGLYSINLLKLVIQ